IPKKQLEKIFDRFHKSSSGEIKNKEGAGIGLAFTKDLVELHRGDISVSSKPGVGTTFTLYVSLDKGQYEAEEFRKTKTSDFQPRYDPGDFINTDSSSDEEEITRNALIQEKRLSEPLFKEKEETPLLLYIDDNADLRVLLRQGMAEEFRVMTADGGQSGIELAINASPDIIISDLMMPEVDGLEVLRSLKKDSRTSHIPIILLTAKDAVEGEAESLGLGADGYLTKPFNMDNLSLLIKNILTSRRKLRERFHKEVITSPKEVAVTNVDEEFLQRAMEVVEANMDNANFSTEEFAQSVHISRSRLHIKLKALTGQSTTEFVRSIRLKRAVQLLEESGYSVKEVMAMTGFNTASYFSKRFKNQFGILPSEYLRRQKEAKEQGHLARPQVPGEG
ncbi:MAG: response regulator, partial [Bacteroidota bacterium]